MGTKMRTRPIARKGEDAPSRKHKREHTKSAIRLNCQRKTRGAANRAAKELTGKARNKHKNWLPLALFLVNDALTALHASEERELELLNDKQIADADADRFFG